MPSARTLVESTRSRKLSVTEILAAKPQLKMTPRHGVLTLFGYGIRVLLERGHLVIEDGIGGDRRLARLPRVGHDLKRLVVIGSDGMISLAALRWLADQKAAFVMLERDGHVLATTGPVRPSDARLRRAQARADLSGAALQITRKLISQKLVGQQRVAQEQLSNNVVGEAISRYQAAVDSADSISAIRLLEAQAGAAYWSAWNGLTIPFPKNDSHRIPDHWRKFSTRKSPISGSPRLATNPLNAILNYLYALLEAEARLALAALGLDPGLGFLHADAESRDSLAFDVMEPVRPQVDGLVLQWIARSPLRREWFFEKGDGNCRLMGSYSVQLTETMPTWRAALAPLAESIAHELWLKTVRPSAEAGPATRLTQRRKREAKGATSSPTLDRAPEPQIVCRLCGIPISHSRTYCLKCKQVANTESLRQAAIAGRMAALSPDVLARQGKAQRRQARALAAWKASEHPAWLDSEFYQKRIRPLLTSVTRSDIASAMGVSSTYAYEIRSGRLIPHQRHWLALARLVGVSPIGGEARGETRRSNLTGDPAHLELQGADQPLSGPAIEKRRSMDDEENHLKIS